MMSQYRDRCFVALTVVLPGLLGPGVLGIVCSRHAYGSAFQLHENSTVSLGTAFAGAASAAATADTAFNNPAGMVELPGTQVEFGGSLIAPSFTFSGTATNALGQPISGTASADGGHAAFVPYGYVTHQINPMVSVGLALTSPFGLATYYGPDFIGRYQADKTELETIDINPNVAVRLAPWLSLGAGVSAQRATAEFATAINSPIVGFGVLHELLPLPDGLFHLRDTNWAVGYNFGGLITFDAQTRLGLTYRSRVQHDFSSTASFYVPFPLSLSPALASGPARTKLVLPDTATASLTHVFTPQLTGYADVAWTDWSVFKTLNVYRTTGELISGTDENYRNTVFVSAGASYRLTPQLTLRSGAGFDVTPTTNAYRTARVPDGNRVLLGLGASYAVSPQETIDIGYSHVFVANASLDELSATGDVLSGHYKSSVDIGSIGVRTAF